MMRAVLEKYKREALGVRTPAGGQAARLTCSPPGARKRASSSPRLARAAAIDFSLM
jgi:hypothetical protein